MGRLKALAPRIGTLPGRLGYADAGEKGHDRRRQAEQPWRGWYKQKRWKDLQQAVFLRDNFICQRTGVVLVGRHPAPNSPVANHKVPHRGDPRLFWDINNIETVAKSVHDREIQIEEQAVPRGRWD